jgi:hypothetical protein
MSDEQDREHQQAFVFYCEQRSQEYRRVFGVEEPEGQILLPPTDLSLFAWPGGGVYQFPPQGKLRHWHYVTEAISQPRDPAAAIKDGHPGYAFELVMSTAERCNWAPNVLMNLARYFFGPKGRPFYHYQCIPCNGPLVLGSETKLTYLLSVPSREYDPVIRLPGGECSLVHLVGVAEEEIKPAFDLEKPGEGIKALYRVLYNHGVGCCSLPERPSLAEAPGFVEEWQAELAAVRAGNGGRSPDAVRP